MALDNFDNKIYAQAKDTYYRPVDSRNRLSINWNPDDKTMEDKTICQDLIINYLKLINALIMYMYVRARCSGV